MGWIATCTDTKTLCNCPGEGLGSLIAAPKVTDDSTANTKLTVTYTDNDNQPTNKLTLSHLAPV